MADNLTCTECGASLAHKQAGAKTCSDTCRSKRSRRLSRQTSKARAQANMPDEYRAVNEVVRQQQNEVGRELLKEELRPVVREAITEDIFRAIRGMVALTPVAVEKLAEDLQSDNESIRHRAAALVVKYTVGHQALVRPDDADAGSQMVVHFNLPRPGSSDTEAAPDVEEIEEAVVLRTCDACGADKPEAAFVANSTRCETCYEEFREQVIAKFQPSGEDDDGSS